MWDTYLELISDYNYGLKTGYYSEEYLLQLKDQIIDLWQKIK